VRLTVEHSYSKKMLESGDNQIKKKMEQPRTFKNPLKLPSPPPHKGSSCPATSLAYYA